MSAPSVYCSEMLIVFHCCHFCSSFISKSLLVWLHCQLSFVWVVCIAGQGLPHLHISACHLPVVRLILIWLNHTVLLLPPSPQSGWGVMLCFHHEILCPLGSGDRWGWVSPTRSYSSFVGHSVKVKLKSERWEGVEKKEPTYTVGGNAATTENSVEVP